MNFMVIGQGGREHAIIRALTQSNTVERIFAIPGSDAIALEKGTSCHSIDFGRSDVLLEFIKTNSIDVAVIGPETPLVDGLADQLRKYNVPVVGPSKEAARLEGSKIYSKHFMLDAGVPMAKFFEVKSVEETLEKAAHFSAPWVLKADGLAAGKGVTINKTLAELKASATDLFVKKTLGAAGERALLEEFTPGWELSYLVLTNGQAVEDLPLAQDHKKLLDGDEGPNTGGMGVVAPLKINSELKKQIQTQVVGPVLKEIQKRELIYRGVLYIGLMITPGGPSVLEFNVRFGDPEAQVLLPLFDGDWAQVFKNLAMGELTPMSWKNKAAACVVLAAPGYPESPQKNLDINGKPLTNEYEKYFLHAGTKSENSKWLTSGGRVLNAVALGESIEEALKKSYALIKESQIEKLIFRRDIGKNITKPT